jgi:hypothetical protein
MVPAMDFGGAKYKIGKRRSVDSFDFPHSPVVPERCHQSSMLTGYTEIVRVLTVIVLLLAVFCASTQCVANCLTEPTTPPCHQHSKSKNSAPESCKLTQPVADAQITGPPAAETPTLAEAALGLLAAEPAPRDSVRSSFAILRL